MGGKVLNGTGEEYILIHEKVLKEYFKEVCNPPELPDVVHFHV